MRVVAAFFRSLAIFFILRDVCLDAGAGLAVFLVTFLVVARLGGIVQCHKIKNF